jgi:hypothetical protein
LTPSQDLRPSAVGTAQRTKYPKLFANLHRNSNYSKGKIIKIEEISNVVNSKIKVKTSTNLIHSKSIPLLTVCV